MTVIIGTGKAAERTETRLFCTDCKHYSGSGWCNHPNLVSPVNGSGFDCEDMRKRGCGPEGRLWEEATPNRAGEITFFIAGILAPFVAYFLWKHLP